MNNNLKGILEYQRAADWVRAWELREVTCQPTTNAEASVWKRRAKQYQRAWLILLLAFIILEARVVFAI